MSARIPRVRCFSREVWNRPNSHDPPKPKPPDVSLLPGHRCSLMSAVAKFLRNGCFVLAGLACVVTVRGASFVMPEGLVLRLDARSLSNEDDTPVSGWNDGSGNANHASQTDGDHQPVFKATAGPNGNPCVRFNGSSSLEIGDASSLEVGELTIIAIAQKNDEPTGNGWLLMKRSDGDSYLQYGAAIGNLGGFGGCQILSFVDGSSWADHVGSSAVPSGFNTLVQRYNGTDVSLQINSDSDGTPSANGGDIPASNGGMSIGASGIGEFFNGDISAILLFNRYLSDTEVASVVAYLQGQWGNASSLAQLTITTSSLSNATVATPYPAATLSASGGTGSGYTWTASELPGGFGCDSGGNITGTTTNAGDFNCSVFVTDSGQNTTFTNLSLHVANNANPQYLTISPSSLPDGVIGSNYSLSLSASGGTGGVCLVG